MKMIATWILAALCVAGVCSMSLASSCFDDCGQDDLPAVMENMTLQQCQSHQTFFGCLDTMASCQNISNIVEQKKELTDILHPICVLVLYPIACEQNCSTAEFRKDDADKEHSKEECDAYKNVYQCISQTEKCGETFVEEELKAKKDNILTRCESGATAPGVAMVTVLVSALVALRLVK